MKAILRHRIVLGGWPASHWVVGPPHIGWLTASHWAPGKAENTTTR